MVLTALQVFARRFTRFLSTKQESTSRYNKAEKYQKVLYKGHLHQSVITLHLAISIFVTVTALK